MKEYNQLTRKQKRLGKEMKFKDSLFIAWGSYLSVFVVSVLFALFYRQTFFYLLVVLLIFLPAFSYCLTQYSFNRLNISMSFSTSTTLKGAHSTLTLIIANSTPVPVSSGRLFLSIRSNFYGGEYDVIHSLLIRAKNNNTLTFPSSFDKYGIYTASLNRLEAYDYLHLFTVKRNISIQSEICILPEPKTSSQPLEIIYTEGFDEFEESSKNGNSSSNVTFVREYLPGDRLQRIHWKLTEKLDKLMVKEFESTSSHEFFLLLELFQPSKEACDKHFLESENTDDSLYSILDNALKKAWEISLDFINNGQTFVFAFYSTQADDFIINTIKTRNDLEEAFVRAYYTPCYDMENLALSVYEKVGLNKGTLIHV